MIFDVDVSQFMPPGLLMQLDEDTARSLLSHIADAARAKWVSLANEKLLRTSQDYVRGIQPVELHGDVATITLLGVWPNKLEEGYGPYDMRDTLLGPRVPVVPPGGGRGKHQTATGDFYRTIAFRVTGPRSTGRNAQKVTDAYARQLGADAANALGNRAWRAMRKLTAGTSNPGEKTKWGERLKTAGTPMDVHGRSHKLTTNPDGTKTLVRGGGREHAAPLFEGAVKQQQTYKRATQSFYGTFRTISTAVPDGWIHPGYEGARLVPEVMTYIDRVGPDMVKAVVDRLGKG